MSSNGQHGFCCNGSVSNHVICIPSVLGKMLIYVSTWTDRYIIKYFNWLWNPQAQCVCLSWLVEFVQIGIRLILFHFSMEKSKGMLYPYCFYFCLGEEYILEMVLIIHLSNYYHIVCLSEIWISGRSVQNYNFSSFYECEMWSLNMGVWI